MIFHLRKRLVTAFALLAVTPFLHAQEPAKPKPASTSPAAKAIAPAAPLLPGPVVAAMQEGKFADAIAGLDRLSSATKDPATLSYYALIRGTAERLNGKADDARTTWKNAIAADPRGLWSTKIRFELAALELAAGRTAPAEELARVETERLLSGDRKDRLAQVYYAFARNLLKPDDAITKADSAGAYALLVQARNLAKGQTLRAQIHLDQARAAQAMGNFNQAIIDYNSYLIDSKGPEVAPAKFSIGECQFAMNQRPAARLTWTDLAAEIAKTPKKDQATEEIRAKALFLIANTYGFPNPPDDSQLNLGVAALRNYLEAYPSHKSAVSAAYNIGVAYMARGKSDAAIAAHRDFLKGEIFKAESDDAKRDVAGLSMAATYQIALILQGQQKFDEAIAAYQSYLARYPNGSQSAAAQRQILETKLLIASDAINREKYAAARAAWAAFVAQYPLDPRVPNLLFQIGQSFTTEKKDDEAIIAWDTLLSKFPNTEPAAHAQFQVALLHENQKGNPAKAIEDYRKINVEPWRSMALNRVAVMEGKELTVVTPRAFRSGETPHLDITSRNLESLTFTAYKLNAEAYFRKKQALGSIESLDIGLVAADAEWTVPVPAYAKYKPVQTTYDLKVKSPGVWVVKVTDEKSLQATTLVLGSDIDVVVKSSREQLLIFAQDMKTGKGRPDARVLVSDGTSVILEKKTGPDGVLLTNWDKPRDPNATLQYLVLDGADAAGTGLGVPGQVAQGLSARAYIYTDRPAYRPGQMVSLRGVVREVANSQYTNPAAQNYKLELFDSRGRMLLTRGVTLSSFGTFHEQVLLDSSAPVGSYRVRLYKPGRSEFSGNFEVQSYRLEKIDLTFDLPKTVYYRGEKVSADVIAKYQYGAPLAGRAIQVNLPDGRIVNGQTDASGKYHVEFTTEGFSEEQALRMTAVLPRDNVGAVAMVNLAVRAFRIDVGTKRDTYLDGESFTTNVNTIDAQGKPTGQNLTLAVIKRITQGGRVTERQVSDQAVITDPKTGEAAPQVKVDDEDGGTFVIRLTGKDRFGNIVFGDRVLNISGKADQTKLRIFADRSNFKVGETASVNLHSRLPVGPALIAWEADHVLQYRLVEVKEGNNPLTWAVEGAQFPNFTLTAARMSGTRFDEARLDVRVERDLRVSLTPKKPAVGPGEVVEVEVTTVDQLNKPVAAEISVALIDRSLLRIYGDNMPAIGPYFYNQTRTGAFTTSASNTFRYTPETTPVAEAVVEEAARERAQVENRVAGNRVRELAKADMPMAMPAPAAMPAAPQAPAKVAAGMEMDQLRDMAAVDKAQIGAGGATFGGEAQDRSAMGRGTMGGMGGGMGGMPGMMTSKAKGANGAMRGDVAFGLGAVEWDEKTGASLKKEAKASNDPTDARRKRAFVYQALSTRSGGEGFDAAALGDEPPTTRERFVETAYWNPSVVTGPDGKTTIAFKAPTALSEYRFTARGVTGAETLVGQTTADLVVRKDFFVDIRTPDALTQGDRPRFVGELHHVGITGAVEVKLTAYAGGRQLVYPKTITLKNDGIDEVTFDAFEVPEGDVVRLTMTATAPGGKADEIISEVPIRPWGVQAYASASGTSSDSSTVFVGLPAGRTYENPEMLVTISPSLKRFIIETALGGDAFPIPLASASRVAPCPPSPLTISDRASDLIAASAALNYLRWAKVESTQEASRLTSRIQGLLAELITLQNDDGGWPWVAPTREGVKLASDTSTSTIAARACAAASGQGLLTDPGVIDRAANFLSQQQSRIEGGDLEMRSMIQYALASMRKGSFESANALSRVRQALPDVALAELALTLAALDRASLAEEVLDILATRAKTEPAQPGQKPLKYWQGLNQHWSSQVETTAMVAQAFAEIRPKSADLEAVVRWLEAHRGWTGWYPQKANGAAVSALAKFYGQAQSADDRYRLIVTVNDAEIYRADIQGTAVGKGVLVPRKALKVGDQNRVRFEVEGRGTYGYSVSLTGFAKDMGPEQDRRGKRYTVDTRNYLASDPELDGKTLPTGFNSVVNPTYFVNRVTQVGLGGRARVEVGTGWFFDQNRPAWARDFMVVEETLPAGTTLIEGSLVSQAQSHTLSGGVLTLYFAPGTHPGLIRYDVFGYLPGQYRAIPTKIRSAYDVAKQHLGPAGELRVLNAGETPNDPYKATPDELLARGKSLFDDGKLADAAGPLEELFGGYTLKDDILKDAARRLLTIHIKEYQPRKVVQDFEVLKEKAPELTIPFDEVAVVGRAYRDIGEHERAYLVWRAIVEASYLEDAQVGEVLRQKGRDLEAIGYLIDLWREYPNTASIEADFFGISQLLAVNAGKAINDPSLRKQLADAGSTRSELLLQAIRLVQVFISQSPKNPLVDEASLALVGSYLELEDFDSVVKLSGKFAGLYPKSNFLDSFQFSEALGRFNLSEYDRAIEVAEKISKATYKDPNGIDQPSPNKWQAIYILGQIYDARRQPAKAVGYYKDVADRFSDAAGALKSMTRKALVVPEVSLVRPGVKPSAIDEVNRKSRGSSAFVSDTPGVPLEYRNITEVDVKVYPVDLLRLYLTRRNLDAIAGIDLAGITPLHESTVKLGDGQDFEDKLKSINLPLEKEGAYLVMIRGENLYTSGIVLVSPIELEVLEEGDAGRVRVTVRDAKTKNAVPKVNVKVIGSDNPTFISGATDLRGVFVADGVRGQVTAVARRNLTQYAFYRGEGHVGASAPAATPPAPVSGKPGEAQGVEHFFADDLGKNVKMQNSTNGIQQIQRLENRYKDGRSGIQVQEAK